VRVVDPFVDWLPDPPASGPTGGTLRSGPLGGLRLAVKDLVDVAGLPTGAGHPLWLATHAIPDRDAIAYARLTSAGAVFVGKVHTDEFAYSMFGSNAHYGTPDNPRAPGHLPGGSSSGPAAAVAAGRADIGLGTDTAGSVRIPASWCGLYGLRPSHHRVSRAGIVPLAHSFDVPGPLCADLATLRLAATALLDGPVAGDPPRRLVLPPDLWARADPAVRAALRPTVDRLRSRLRTDDRPALPGRLDYPAAFAVVQGREFWRAHGEWITRERPDFGTGVVARVRAAATRTDGEVDAARPALAAARSALCDLLGTDGVLAVPSTPTPAPPREGLTDVADLRRRLLALTTPASLAGLPALSLPAGTVHGRPVGLSLIGPPGADEHLVDLASTIDRTDANRSRDR
jgi:amidase